MTPTPLLASRARRHEPRTGHRDSSLDSGETPARLSPNNSRPGPPARAPADQLTFPAEPLTPRHRSSPTTRKGCLDQPASEAARECLRTASDTTTAATVHSQPRLGPRPVLLVFQKWKGRGRARQAAEGAVAFHQSKGDGNGVSGVNFRHPPTLRTENIVHKTAVSSHSAAHSRRVCNMSGAAINHTMVWHNKHHYQESTARLATRKGSKQHGNRNQETTTSRQLLYG